MHERCISPVWPCAMVGAASCMAGIRDLGVIIHGSAGCYNYAEMAIPDPLNCTYLIEDEIVFGTEARLRETAGALSQIYDRIAVINTCVPSITGEDLEQFLEDYNAIVLDLPGFSGDFDTGYQKALETLEIIPDSEREGVNISGVCSTDPFSGGNLAEAVRLFHLAGIKSAAVYCRDTFESIRSPAEHGISVNPDYDPRTVTSPGSILGIEELIKAFCIIQNFFQEADIDPVISEAEEAEERIVKACDKYLRKNDPPRTAVFSTRSYAEFAVKSLVKYLDAEIVFTGLRNSEEFSIQNIPSGKAVDIRMIREKISTEEPDLILGSSFENVVSPKTPFVGITFPQRSRVVLHNKPVAGTEGALVFIGDVLNSLR
ncbi:nitrogenase component 1 [Methanolacinia paynteri]|uniref:nitrogenase component 1 n=1 Tax=Methanolacinia paynteri TaxID=230356 RepID=UPI00064F3EED|nr:nitrogenase component 1 [Methanolacinia paynteri]